MPEVKAPMHPARALALGGALAAIALTGCYMPGRSVHAVLEIAEGGSLRLQGAPTDQAHLREAVGALAASAPSVTIEIQASPRVEVAAIQQVVATLKDAQVHVAFAGATAAR
jgi:biopolymer transport protein ExbD